jgi:hypothetical protein
LGYWNVAESASYVYCKHCLVHSFIASASYLNPLTWVKEKFAPGQKEQQSKEEKDAAKKKAVAEGQTSIFDSVASTAREVSKRKDADELKKPRKPKATTVRFGFTFFYLLVLKRIVA